MQQATYEEPQRELRLLFDYNPPLLIPDSKSSTLCPQLAAPPSFYEKHLDDSLTLKKVVLMPFITTGLSETVDKTLNSIEQRKLRLPSYGPMDRFPTQLSRASSSFKDSIIDADSVAQAYRCSTAVHCMIVASMLFLSPRASRWDRTLNWIQGYARGLEDPRALEEDHALKLLYIPGTSSTPIITIPDVIWDAMDNEIRRQLSQVAKRFPTLAVWQIFPVSKAAEHILDDMSRIASLENFCYDRCQTTGHKAAPPGDLPYAPDATLSSWGVPLTSLPEIARSSTSSAHLPQSDVEQEAASESSVRRTKNIINSDSTSTPSRSNKVVDDRGCAGNKMTAHSTSNETRSHITVADRSSSTATCLTTSLLQRAWYRSVIKDSTFIIFHCGNFERIGFRHRATQTLFLSELIDIQKCKDPGYGKLHVGLYMSILHDAMERASRQCLYEDQNITFPKRRRQTRAPGAPYKRPKTRAYAARELADGIERRKTYNLVSREALTRNVVVVQLRYGYYNSPTPASFLRVGKLLSTDSKTYPPDQYITLIVGSEIAAGATGIVHNGSLEIFTTSEGVHTLKVVVKFAMKPQQQSRLRHEFSVYQHLASSSVEGVPSAFGLFKDTESDILALVMTHVGICLLDREPKASEIIVRDPERAAFLRVMEDIHRAGVRHHDPRVENLMVQDDGSVAIIDFDRAELDASESSKAREILYLKDILDGAYPSRDGWPTEQTSRTSDTDSFTNKRRWSDSGSETE